MAGISRRRLIGTVAGAAPLVVLGGSLATPPAGASMLLVHDDTLAGGRRFAAHAAALGGSSQVLRGERVRLIRTLLAQQPARVFGVTRHADHLLFAEIAREAGYEQLASIQHRNGRKPLANGSASKRPLLLLAHAAGSCWPEAFAELARDDKDTLSPIETAPPPGPAFSWVLRRKA